MNDFDVISGASTVMNVADVEDGRSDVVLDATVFYARGGGQDWDTGVIRTGQTRFAVDEVRLDEHGVVHHFGTFGQGSFGPGDGVTNEVSTDRRVLNTRLHSGGHILDMAVDELGLPWVPGKGAHYPHMSFVEYASDFTTEQAAEAAERIGIVAKRLIDEDRSNSIEFMPAEKMHEICRHVPDNLPKNKPSRVVVYGGTFGVPCGGTHVKTTGGIGNFEITKVKAKKGVVKVSYALPE